MCHEYYEKDDENCLRYLSLLQIPVRKRYVDHIFDVSILVIYCDNCKAFLSVRQ